MRDVTQSIEIDVLDYLLIHREGILKELKPSLYSFLDTEAQFCDLPELFQNAYQEFFMRELIYFLISTSYMGYNDLSNLSFDTATQLLGLDKRGRDVPT